MYACLLLLSQYILFSELPSQVVPFGVYTICIMHMYSIVLNWFENVIYVLQLYPTLHHHHAHIAFLIPLRCQPSEDIRLRPTGGQIRSNQVETFGGGKVPYISPKAYLIF